MTAKYIIAESLAALEEARASLDLAKKMHKEGRASFATVLHCLKCLEFRTEENERAINP